LDESHSTNGLVVLKDKNITLNMHFDGSLFDVVAEKQIVTDPHLTHVWGDHVNRVTLVSKQKELRGQFTTTFKLT